MKIIKFSNEIINADHIVRFVKDKDATKQKDSSICINFSPNFRVFYDFINEQDRDQIFDSLTNFLSLNQEQFLDLETYEIVRRVRTK